MTRTAYILLMDFRIEIEGIDGPYQEWHEANVGDAVIHYGEKEFYINLSGVQHRITNPINPDFYEMNQNPPDGMYVNLFLKCKEDEIEKYRGVVLGTRLDIL